MTMNIVRFFMPVLPDLVHRLVEALSAVGRPFELRLHEAAGYTFSILLPLCPQSLSFILDYYSHRPGPFERLSLM
eukprot:Pgem_evm1s17657